jgi:hypothetical protein
MLTWTAFAMENYSNCRLADSRDSNCKKMTKKAKNSCCMPKELIEKDLG